MFFAKICNHARKRSEQDLEELSNNIRFSKLINICEKHFNSPRKKGLHFIFKTPWKGDPRINLQEEGGVKAKAYQVKQVRRALLKLLETNE